MTAQSTDTAPQRLRIAAYVILLTAIAFGLADLLLSVQPMRPGAVQWRFGVVGLAANAVVAPLVLLLLLATYAWWMGDRRVLMSTSVISGLLVLLLVLGIGAFVLDGLQMRRQVRPEALPRFDTATVQALGKMLLASIGAGLLSVGAFQAARALRAVTVQRQHAAPTLIVGTGASSRTGGSASPLTASGD